MVEFPTGILIVVSLAIGASIISMLHVFSCVMKHEVTLHDLRNRVERLHNDYALHLARLSGEIPEDSETTAQPANDAGLGPIEQIAPQALATESTAGESDPQVTQAA